MEATAKDWLDSLSAGTCELNALIKGMTDLLRRSPEEGWELLSIVDQYYRRGKISATVFATLKAHLQSLLMGKNRPDVSVPMPRPHSDSSSEPVLSSATIPVAVEGTAIASTDSKIPPPTALAPPTPSSIAIGSVLRGRYKVLGVLGHGGTGTVFEATDLYRLDAGNDQEKIAVKILHPNVLRRPPLFAELRREFQRLQLLSHPNIVRVHEFDRDGETAFFTMEHLSGVLLSRVIAVRESAPVRRMDALVILRDIAAAISYAHSRGIIHGDISPGNIFVCNDGELRVLDFGSNGVATPTFASCQVLEGAAPDARDDVYGLACIAYVLLAGVHPFQGQSALTARDSKLKLKRPRGLRAVEWQALRSGLRLERDDRPSDIAAWASELNPRPPTQRLPTLPTVMSAANTHQELHRWPALAAALVIVIVAAVWWALAHRDLIGAAIAKLNPAHNARQASQSAPDAAVPTPDFVTHDVQFAPSAATTVVSAAVIPEHGADDGHMAAATAIESGPTTLAPGQRNPPAAPTGPVVPPTSPGSRARLELTSDNVEAVRGESLVRVMVRRSRSMRGDVSFSWWTESGTAQPGRDFAAVASHVEQIVDGQSAINLVVPIIADPQRRQARNFYVVIDAASPTAAVGPRTLAMVTLPELN